ERWEFETFDHQSVDGSEPDPILVVGRWQTTYGVSNTMRFEVVAWSEWAAPGSTVAHIDQEDTFGTGTHFVFMFSRHPSLGGTADLAVRRYSAGGTLIQNFAIDDIRFGTHASEREFRDGDTFFATKPGTEGIWPVDPNAPDFADTFTLVMDRVPEWNCWSTSEVDCGTAWVNDDDITPLSRVDV